jgi:transposase
MKQPTTIGIDLAKSVFQAHGVDAAGAIVVKRKRQWAQVLTVFAGLGRAASGWKPAPGHTSGHASFKRSGTTFASCHPPT